MAEHKKNSEHNVSEEAQETTKRKTDPKKIIIVIVVMALVILGSVLVDRKVNPEVIDGNDAVNRMLDAGVIMNHPEIDYETSVQIDNFDAEKIDGKTCYPVEIILHYDTPEAKVLPRYYVEISSGKIFQVDANGKLIPYGV